MAAREHAVELTKEIVSAVPKASEVASYVSRAEMPSFVVNAPILFGLYVPPPQFFRFASLRFFVSFLFFVSFRLRFGSFRFLVSLRFFVSLRFVFSAAKLLGSSRFLNFCGNVSREPPGVPMGRPQAILCLHGSKSA